MSGSELAAAASDVAPTAAEPSKAPLADLKEDWHALAWRPAGSMSLAERWLSAGAPFKEQKRSKRRRR